MKRGQIAIVLAVVVMTIAAGCSTSDTKNDQPAATAPQSNEPLTKPEKTFIKLADQTHRLAAKTIAALTIHARNMIRGTATSEQDRAGQKVYNSVVKTLRGWQTMEQPSERMTKAWDLWFKVLNGHIQVFNKYASFHNDIGSDAKLNTFLNAILKPGRDYGRFTKEIKRIKQLAATSD